MSLTLNTCVALTGWVSAPSDAAVQRHQARVIKLLYCGEGPVTTTLMLVGKVRGPPAF